MESPLIFHEFKKQASSFFKDKIKTARLALTDVTPVQLMTEEAIVGSTWPPDTRAIGVISRAAFEVDDYWRIVDILHRRLVEFDRKKWRESYKALILLEHLLTHGPLRIADEFIDDTEAVKDISSFQYIDEKGFNWGSSVSKLCERVLRLIQEPAFLKQERAVARKLTRGIEGFGSFVRHSPSRPFTTYGRSNSQHNTRQKDEHGIGGGSMTEDEDPKENHPFCDDERQSTNSLISSVQ